MKGKRQQHTLLVSINFESSKGGVSRVAHLMHNAIDATTVLSLYGNTSLSGNDIQYFAQNRISFIRALAWNILFQRPSIIIFDHVGPASLLAIIPQLLLKKVIVFLHDEEAWKPVSARHKMGLDKATHLLCNSQYTYQKFIAHNPIYKSKTQVCLLAGIPSSFENNEAIPTPELFKNWFTNTTPYVIFVSRLWKEHRYKGHLELIAAFKILKDKNLNLPLRLAIIGQGDDAAYIQQQLISLKLENNISLFTNVSDDDLSKFYSHSCGLVFPSIREGFGFVFLEAMYFGKPCIGVVDQPAEEIIVPNVSGILMKDNSPQSIVEVLEDIIVDAYKYECMGLEGKKIYEEKFTNKHFQKRFLKCIS